MLHNHLIRFLNFTHFNIKNTIFFFEMNDQVKLIPFSNQEFSHQ